MLTEKRFIDKLGREVGQGSNVVIVLPKIDELGKFIKGTHDMIFGIVKGFGIELMSDNSKVEYMAFEEYDPLAQTPVPGITQKLANFKEYTYSVKTADKKVTRK